MQIPLTKQLYLKKFISIYFIYLLIVVLFGNNWITLWDQDEAAYAGFAKNMLDSGNYLIPNYTWSDVHRKTPLHFWTIALSYKIFGINEFAVRFPSAISIWLTTALIYLFGKSVFGKKESFIASIVISTSFLVMSLAKISVVDGGVLLYSTICGFSIVHILLFRKKIHVPLFWFAFSLAILAKGPPIIIFTFLFGIILFIFHPKRKNLIILHPWIFLPISLIPLLYWVHLCNQTEEGTNFIHWLIDWYILKRIGGSVLGQSAPPGTHFLVLLVVFANYLLWIPGTLIQSIKASWKNRNSLDFILISWFVSGWLIYEFSPSKLPSYIIAAHVPFAILIAKTIVTPSKKIHLVTKLFYIGINSLIFIGISSIPFVIELRPLSKYVLILAGLFFLIVFIYINIIKSRKNTEVFGSEINEKKGINQLFKRILIFNIMFHAVIWMAILPLINEIKNSTYRVSQFIDENAENGSSVIIANNSAHPPSLPFYLKQKFTTVKEEYDFNTLQTIFYSKDPTVIILNKKTLTQYQEKDPNITYDEIITIKSKIIKSSSYYIIMNGVKKEK